jgi:hypothetical protein
VNLTPGQNVIIRQPFNAICGTVDSLSEDGNVATLSNAFDMFGPLGARRVCARELEPFSCAPRVLGLADL